MKQFLEIGQIVSIQGIKGEVRVKPWCDDPQFLCEFDELYFDEGMKTVAIEYARVQKNIVIMKLKGADTVETAQKMRNRILFMNRNDVELDENTYFIQDLIGMDVFDADNSELIGKLTEVSATGANDVYHIDVEGKEYLIPAIPDVVVETDVEGGKMLIRKMKGLFDDED